MSSTRERVTSAEIFALTRETSRLLCLGDQATEECRAALREWKIDVLDRIAMDSDLCGNEKDARHVRQIARREAAALKVERVATWGEPA
jgi:hypothetical protein